MFNFYNEAILSQPPFLLQLPSKKSEYGRYKRFCLYGLTNLLLTFINNYEVKPHGKSVKADNYGFIVQRSQ